MHSAAAAVTTVVGLTGFVERLSTPEAPAASAAPEAATEATEAAEAGDVAETADAASRPGARAAEAAATSADEAAAAAVAAAVAAASDAVVTCWMDPSITTREPWMPAPRWATFSVSDDVSASLLRINCSHASEFLKVAVQAASKAPAAVMHAIERIRIFIDVPFFKPSAIVAYGVLTRRRNRVSVNAHFLRRPGQRARELPAGCSGLVQKAHPAFPDFLPQDNVIA